MSAARGQTVQGPISHLGGGSARYLEDRELFEHERPLDGNCCGMEQDMEGSFDMLDQDMLIKNNQRNCLNLQSGKNCYHSEA